MLIIWLQGGDNYGYDSSPPGRGRGRGMGAPRRFFRRGGGFRGGRGGAPPRRPYQDENQVTELNFFSLIRIRFYLIGLFIKVK